MHCQRDLITIGQEFTITAGNLFQTHAAAVAGPNEFLVAGERLPIRRGSLTSEPAGFPT